MELGQTGGQRMAGKAVGFENRGQQGIGLRGFRRVVQMVRILALSTRRSYRFRAPPLPARSPLRRQQARASQSKIKCDGQGRAGATLRLHDADSWREK